MDISWLQLQNESVLVAQSLSSLALLYLVTSIILRKPVFLLAYLFIELTVISESFLVFAEWEIYLIQTIVYTFVISQLITKKQVLACGILWAIAASAAADAFIYGQTETVFYRNIESIALCAHLFFIYTLLPIRRIFNNLKHSIGTFCREQGYDVHFFFFCYNDPKKHP